MLIRSLAAAALVVLSSAGGSARSRSPMAPVPDDERAVLHALNRLTYGPRPGDVRRVLAMGLPSWIDQELSSSRVDNDALDARLAGLTTLTLDAGTLAREYHTPAQRERRRLKGTEPAAREPNAVLRKDRQIVTDLSQAKILRAIYSNRQLEEVLVDFWFNHFNVFAGKGPERVWVGEYEREAIRPYVLGNFRNMLEEVAKSEAMLFYLDNWQSGVPNSAGTPEPRNRRSAAARGPFARRPKGINENYARELMELHTLGVEGGYTQQDVTEVARAFTGWTMGAPAVAGFRFDASIHDGGEKRVLGHTIKSGGGMNDGRQVLDILASHPSTAQFIARKLAVRFVSDDPPQALVDRAAARFTVSKGDLREVLRIILTSPEFFAAAAYRAKVKTPFEFVVSALRATGAVVRNALPLVRELRDLGMPLYMCQPPTGYDETAVTWVSSGALVNRMNFALALGNSRLRGVVMPLVSGTTPARIRDAIVGDVMASDVSEATLATIDKATTADQALALAIGSPEFQRR